MCVFTACVRTIIVIYTLHPYNGLNISGQHKLNNYTHSWFVSTVSLWLSLPKGTGKGVPTRQWHLFIYFVSWKSTVTSMVTGQAKNKQTKKVPRTHAVNHTNWNRFCPIWIESCECVRLSSMSVKFHDYPPKHLNNSTWSASSWPKFLCGGELVMPNATSSNLSQCHLVTMMRIE